MAITITSVVPSSGPTTGGTTHRITGVDLDTVTSVKVGGAAAVYDVEDPTLLKFTLPAHGAGPADVVLGPGAVTATGGITYAAPAADEQLIATVVTKWGMDVNTGTAAAPVWTRVRAIGEIKPAVESNMEDDSDLDSDGWGSETKTQIKWSLEVKFLRKRGVTSGTYDPGQEAVRAAHDQFGAAGTVQVRWYDRLGGPEAYTGYASVGWEPDGGAATALDSVTVTLSGQGKRTPITNPAA